MTKLHVSTPDVDGSNVKGRALKRNTIKLEVSFSHLDRLEFKFALDHVDVSELKFRLVHGDTVDIELALVRLDSVQEKLGFVREIDGVDVNVKVFPIEELEVNTGVVEFAWSESKLSVEHPDALKVDESLVAGHALEHEVGVGELKLS